MRPVITRITAQAILIVLATAAMAVPASAHAVLVSSTPKNNVTLKAPPKQAVLRFNSRIEKRVAHVTILDCKGRQMKMPPAPHGYTAGRPNQLIVPLPALKPGSYELRYEVLATDGHLTPGLIRFTISGGKPR